MNRSTYETLLHLLETCRLRKHFSDVEGFLRQQDSSHLAPQQQKTRKQHLAQLRYYAERGLFPSSKNQHGYGPCFIDHHGRECAVAHLIQHSHQPILVNKIASNANEAYIHQMHFKELDIWADEEGFTREELALIQPGYYDTFEGALLNTSIILWISGGIATLLNVIGVIGKHTGRFVPRVAWCLVILLVIIGVYCLFASLDAYSLGINNDVGDVVQKKALEAASGLGGGGVVSLVISLAAGTTAHYRLRSLDKSKANQN